MADNEIRAGHQMDAAIVRRALGIKRLYCHHGHLWGGSLEQVEDCRTDRMFLIPNDKPWRTHYRHARPVPLFSTNIAAAMSLVDAVLAQRPGAAFNLMYQPTHDWPREAEESPAAERWLAGFGISGTDMCWQMAYAESKELAICRAVLQLNFAAGPLTIEGLS